MRDTFRRAALTIGLLLTAAITDAQVGSRSEPVALQAFSEGQGSPLVMLGGGIYGAAMFAPHAQVLAKDFRVIRLQTLNVERSQRQQALPPGYSVKHESAAMARALDQLGMTRPVDIVGSSFGALVALDFALDHPARVHTLVLFEPPAFWVVPRAELRAASDMRTMYELTQEFGPETHPTDAQLLRFRCALGVCGEKPPAPEEAGWQEWISRRAALRGLSVVANHTDDPNRLKQLRRPVLIMTGSNTVSFHRRINEILAGSLPLAERVDIPGGHSAPGTARDEFLATLRAFLARHQSD